MKKIMIFIASFLLLMGGVMAIDNTKYRNSYLKIDSLDIYNYFSGDEYTNRVDPSLIVYLNIENKFFQSFKNVKITIVVDELGYKKSFGPLKINYKNSESVNIPLEFEEEIGPGIYTARVYVYDYSTQLSRRTFRWFVVE